MSDTLKDIKLTKEGQKPFQEIHLIADPEKTDMIQEPVPSTILEILKVGISDKITSYSKDPETGDKIIREKEIIRHALSVVEIMKRSEEEDIRKPISMSQIYHHLPKLIESDFVIKYGTLKKGGRTTDYYRRVAEVIMFSPTPPSDTVTEDEKKQGVLEIYRDYIRKLTSLFRFNISDDEFKALLNLLVKREWIENTSEAMINLKKRCAKDIVSNYDMTLLHDILILYHLDNPEWLRINQQIREILYKKEDSFQ